MITAEDVEGALRNLKDEIPKLQHAHTRVMQHFKGMDLDDLDSCILSLENEVKRQRFQLNFQKFSQQVDVVFPDPAAIPFVSDLRKLGKISHGAKNLFRDEQLSIAGAGEKVRKLIEDHIFSTGVDPKIPPVDLLAADFKEKLDDHKSDRVKASEIEYAIRHHIKIKLENDPEYYQSLSEKLESIIRKHQEKWEGLVQLLMDFRDTIEEGREARAEELGLTETEFAFHGLLMAEITKGEGIGVIDEDRGLKMKRVVRKLVTMMDEATEIVDFFDKYDEQKRVGRDIKRAIIEEFDDPELARLIARRFMELAKVKFR